MSVSIQLTPTTPIRAFEKNENDATKDEVQKIEDPNQLLLKAALHNDLHGIRLAQKLGADINYASQPPLTSEIKKEEKQKGDNEIESQNQEDKKDHLTNLTLPLSTEDTALHISAELGFVEASRLLIDLMADVDKKNRIGSTALHRAVSFGQVEEVKFLIQRQADIHAENKIGNTPLHVACYMGSIEMIFLLIKSGARNDFEKQNRCGMTPFDYLPVKLKHLVIPHVPKSLLPK